jgi:hypothetical protein
MAIVITVLYFVLYAPKKQNDIIKIRYKCSVPIYYISPERFKLLNFDITRITLTMNERTINLR